uniref:Uncharacterized protein n=1 Tax=viral metagenome TaxID=1070528 RepID=A0A6C0ADC8_9ZZZZ
MTDYRMRIEGLRKSFLISKFKEELKEYSDYNFQLEDKRKNQLEKIIDVLETGKKNIIKEVKFRDRSSKHKIYTNKIEDYFSQLDNIVYQKRWNSLRDFHKEKKLEEWVKEQSLSNKKKESLLIDIMDAFKDKKIHTEKNVNYNKTTMKIENISGIEIYNKTDSYNVLKKKKV